MLVQFRGTVGWRAASAMGLCGIKTQSSAEVLTKDIARTFLPTERNGGDSSGDRVLHDPLEKQTLLQKAHRELSTPPNVSVHAEFTRPLRAHLPSLG